MAENCSVDPFRTILLNVGLEITASSVSASDRSRQEEIGLN
jgi:hypothetical protein